MTTTMKKQLLAAAVILIAIIAIVCAFVPQFAFAQENPYSQYFSGGDGSTSNPFRITNEAELRHINDTRREEDGFYYVDYSFILINEITLTYDWQPVSGYFRGVFDGNNKTINNMKLNASAKEYCGFFEIIEGGTVKNLRFDNAKITCNNTYELGNIGIIVGLNYGTITNCIVSGTITANNGYNCNIGGICGSAYSGYINNCTSTVNITGAGNIGGIAGLATTGRIYDCKLFEGSKIEYYYSTVNGCVGGIVGKAKATTNIQFCINYGDIIYGSEYNKNKNIQPCMGQIVGELNKSVAVNNKSSGSTDYSNLKQLFLSTNQLAYCSNGDVGRNIS